jgi:hypothetical protein
MLWIEDILKQLGYEIDENVHIYWCLPGKAICEGLVLIKSDADILQMIRAADNHKTLCLMVDHSDFLRNLREDVTINRVQQVAPIIYPNKNTWVQDACNLSFIIVQLHGDNTWVT